MVRLICAASLVLLFQASLGAQTPAGGPLEFGKAVGRPGEVVEVQILGTFDHPLIHYFFPLQFDATRLEFLRLRIDGTAASVLSPLGVGFKVFQPGDAGVGVHSAGLASWEEPSVPPGDGVLIGKIEFRILAAALPGTAFVKPVRKIPETAGTPCYELILDRSTSCYSPETLIEGAVDVLEPVGPRPVGDFRCGQLLDRIDLSFTLTEAYDGIEISRNGSFVAALPGDSTGYSDPLPGIGAFKYSATAIRGSERSVAVGCELLAVSPAAPPVEDLQCSDGGLSWTNPVTYDGIAVFRNGEKIADLPGDARSFTDPDPPDELTVYGIAGELEGFRSPDVNCLDHGTWIMEVGDVQVPRDAKKFAIPIFVTTSKVIRGIEFHLQIEMDRLEYIEDREAALQGCAGYPDPEFLASGGIGVYGVPAAGMVWDQHSPRETFKDFPVGLRQRVFNFVFLTRGEFSEGETLEASIRKGAYMLYNTTSQRVDTFIPGQVRFGSAGVKSVKNLKSSIGAAGGGGAGGSSTVALTWENGGSYESLRIERNGAAVAEIPGTSTGFEDRDVPRGVFTYKVTGVSRGKASFPASTFLSTVAPRGTFLRCDANRDGRVDIADPVATLNFLFLGGSRLPCEDAADADDDGLLTIADPIVAIQYLLLGGGTIKAPGTAYPWFDPTPDNLSCEK